MSNIISDNIKRIMQEKSLTQDALIYLSWLSRDSRDKDSPLGDKTLTGATIKNTITGKGGSRHQLTIELFAEALEVPAWQITLPYEEQQKIKEYQELKDRDEKHNELLRRLG